MRGFERSGRDLLLASIVVREKLPQSIVVVAFRACERSASGGAGSVKNNSNSKVRYEQQQPQQNVFNDDL